MSELDLDAITAAESEVHGDAHKVIWGGETFAVPRTNDWPLDTFDVLGRGEFGAALAMVLGDQWGPFCAAKPPTLGTAKALLDAISEREGFENLGNSRASSPSSNRATRRSKPTS